MGLSSGPNIYLQDAGQHQLKGGQGKASIFFLRCGVQTETTLWPESYSYTSEWRA
jgi:hypothetical protein